MSYAVSEVVTLAPLPSSPAPMVMGRLWDAQTMRWPVAKDVLVRADGLLAVKVLVAWRRPQAVLDVVSVLQRGERAEV